ncbi:ABC transporter [Oceanobacillus oncorhynchi subsp. incaldanensis]|uniref:ABC transporter ATP-binding protein YtrB n=2 Tax=Oceanobacillus TaxID=182709 RepID=A0A0A1MGT0_9BACI|nr:ABC transporter ATP-binding protein [Oceanobacillus oncorhynchi]MDM8100345.1 ABC transporter ATP-binding protein [Oceanobacillus oncorhynchi]UUI40842.1 ABC transporter ATP-binding protein [Oceanobacillus oncorhynchi]GIO18704.1 ABC transporter [Oceanobacillus oncorhynchi subsp. incaldanensis]CEI82278.1 ABC transporter ATP-binding protein YtrB [Oceanobacillus oncorhynchi]
MAYPIEVRHLTVHYKKYKALEDVSFTLSPGKVHGILGRNGAGKTTLLTYLASFHKVKRGTIVIDGEDPFENERILQGTSFIYDKDNTYDYDKIAKILKGMLYFRPNFDEAYAKDLAAKFNIPMDKSADQLSKGQYSALQVTIGLASRTPLTIFDEAYLGMDAPARELFYKEILLEQERHPRTILFSTHLVSEMEYLFDEVLIIDNGKVLLQETSEQLLEKGFSITGPEEDVDSFTETLEVIHEKSLGGTKSVMVYGTLTEQEQREAAELGLEVGTLSLNNLFIHLTKEGEET